MICTQHSLQALAAGTMQSYRAPCPWPAHRHGCCMSARPTACHSRAATPYLPLASNESPRPIALKAPQGPLNSSHESKTSSSSPASKASSSSPAKASRERSSSAQRSMPHLPVPFERRHSASGQSSVLTRQPQAPGPSHRAPWGDLSILNAPLKPVELTPNEASARPIGSSPHPLTHPPDAQPPSSAAQPARLSGSWRGSEGRAARAGQDLRPARGLASPVLSAPHSPVQPAPHSLVQPNPRSLVQPVPVRPVVLKRKWPGRCVGTTQ